MQKLCPLLTVVVNKYYSNDSLPNTLSLMPDDIVQVLAMPNSIWWDGVIVDPVGNVSRGWFPASYTSPLNQPVSTQAALGSPVKDHQTNTKQMLNPYHQTSITTLKNQVLNETNAPTSKHGSMTSGRSHSNQASQPVSDGTTTSLYVVSSEEAASYFQPTQNKSQPGFDFIPVWVPQINQDDNFIFYNQALNIHSTDLPFVPSNFVTKESTYEVPDIGRLSTEITSTVPISIKRGDSVAFSNASAGSDTASIYNIQLYHGSNNDNSTSNPNAVGSSNGNNSIPMLQTTSQVILPKESHIVHQPYKFYLDVLDMTHWSDLMDSFNDCLNQTVTYLKNSDKFNFKIYVNKATGNLTNIHIAGKLIITDLESNHKKEIFSVVLKRLTNLVVDWRVWTQLHMINLENTEINSRLSIDPSIGGNCIEKIELLVLKISKVSNILLNLIQSLNVSNGGDPNQLPVIYTRFIKGKFESEHFKNQFVDQSRDELLDKSHAKSNSLLDDDILGQIKSIEQKVNENLEQMQLLMRKKIKKGTIISDHIKSRNLELLTLVYQALPILKQYLTVVESVDFTVFVMIDKLANNGAISRNDTIITGDSNAAPPLEDNNQSFYDTTAKIIRPMTKEFTHLKQMTHSCFTDLILDAQLITADDPEVFFSTRLDIEELENSLNLSTDISLSASQSKIRQYARLMRKRLERLDRILFNDGLYNAEPSLKFIDTLKLIKERMQLMNMSLKQLKDQRVSILNYCTRLMNTDINIASLFIAERHNTLVFNEQPELFYGGTNRKMSDAIKPIRSEFYPHLDIEPTHWFLALEENEKDLFFDYNGIRGGTIPSLISKLVNPLMERDELFEQTMSILFVSILKPSKFFDLLIDKYNISMPEALSYEEYGIWLEKKVKPQQQRVIEFLKNLFSKYWLVQYTTPELIQIWRDFTNENVGTNFPEELASLGLKVMGFTTQDEYNLEFGFNNKEPATIPMAPLTNEIKKMKLLEMNIDHIAKQITCMQAFYYRKINRNDLLFRSYNFVKLLKVKRKKDLFDYRSISNFIKNCNQLTHFTCYMILRKTDENERIDIIKFFINLAEKLLFLKNFSSMTAIISALSSTSIARLRKTWDLIPKSFMLKFQKMDNLMSIGKNYAEYRNILKFVEHGDIPYLPFLGMYLSDLRFTTDGNSDWLDVNNEEIGSSLMGGSNSIFTTIASMSTSDNYHGNIPKVVNFSKRMNIVKIINQVLEFNETLYNIPYDENFICYLDTIFEGLPDDEVMYEMSINIEPRVSILKSVSNVNGSISSNATNGTFNTLSSGYLSQFASNIGSISSGSTQSASTKRMSNLSANAMPISNSTIAGSGGTSSLHSGHLHHIHPMSLTPSVSQDINHKRKIRGYRHLLSGSEKEREREYEELAAVGLHRGSSGVSLLSGNSEKVESRSGSMDGDDEKKRRKESERKEKKERRIRYAARAAYGI
ncbi:Ras family guanine nucleotide exchange factor [Martiniozyma asiatica (nom. inval.)]|nr:Ras family guanine nucleotide exchange factor [Martiniozyma asiatica]